MNSKEHETESDHAKSAGKSGSDLRGTDSGADSTLGRKLLGWSNNLLSTSLILLIAITIGVQVIRYWRIAPSVISPKSSSPNPLIDGQLSHLSFGDSSDSMLRHEISGSMNDAMAAIADQCQAALVAYTAPRDLTATTPIGEKEQILLRSLRNKDPARERRGHWQIFVQTGPIPMAIGVSTEKESTGSTLEDSVKKNRVVCWTLALPATRFSTAATDSDIIPKFTPSEPSIEATDSSNDEKAPVKLPSSKANQSETQTLSGPQQVIDHWTLVTWQPFRQPASKTNAMHWLALPRGSQRNLTLDTSDNGVMVGFSGHGESNRWKQFFTTHFEEQNWKTTSWVLNNSIWHTRVKRPNGDVADLYLDDRLQTLSGMIYYRSSAGKTEEE